MEYFAVVIWHGDMALLDPPAIACRSWHPREDPDLAGDDLELELELDLHARGWRKCDGFSRYVPEGEFGHLSHRRHEEHVHNAAARAAARDSAVEPVIVFTPRAPS